MCPPASAGAGAADELDQREQAHSAGGIAQMR
jgi:hypothetical protein